MFDSQKRASSWELQARCKEIAVRLESHERALGNRKRVRKEDDRRSFRLAVEAIICNLVALRSLDPERQLAVPRSSGVMWSKGRYASAVYGQHFLDALSLMMDSEISLLADVRRGFRVAGGNSQQSVVARTAAFDECVPDSSADIGCVTREADGEVLILKGEKNDALGRSEPIPYDDTRRIKQMRNEVRAINTFLLQARIKLSLGEGDSPPFLEDDEGRLVDPTRRSLRRIFNNGSWQEGGRLFDGFWETMRRADRFKFLRIGTAAEPEGEPIANVDFSQLFPRLAYRHEGQRAPEGDLYALLGGDARRDGIKKLTNALLFARGPLTKWPFDTVQLFPKGTKLQDVIAAIVQSHAPIAPLFGTGIGFRLMFQESNILIEALKSLYAERITALPLHDSVLVGRSDAETAKRAMSEAFSAVIGESCGTLQVHFG